jgi:hypothetical protein
MDIPQFKELNCVLLTTIRSNPTLLKQKQTTIQAKLQSQGNEESQGTGNKVTEQEAAFAAVLEAHGFTFLPKQKKNQHLTALPKEGIFYIYQANGSQASIDFQTLFIHDSAIKSTASFDLKHTTGKNFYLNDGWFHKDIIYIVTWSPKRGEVKTFLGLGQDIPTENETSFMTKLLELKRSTNETNKKVESLRPYIRFANQYSCEKFTDDYSADRFAKVLSCLATSL